MSSKQQSAKDGSEPNATRPTFDILPAERADIPRLAYIHVVTCMADNAFKLYFDSAAEFTKRVIEMLEGQIDDPGWHHAKAVDRATGTIASWASWNTPSDQQIRNRDDAAAVPVTSAAFSEPETHDDNIGKGEFDFPPGLPMFVQADTDKWIKTWTSGRRHILLKALFTDPPFQRRGMGNALVRYGNGLADAAGLPILLQASAYGWPVYSKQGFHTVQHLDVDLRTWAPGAQTGERGFGNYRFRYMIRLPLTLS